MTDIPAQILVMSGARLRVDYLQSLSSQNAAIISIRGRWSEWTELPQGSKCGILKVCFEDWERLQHGRTITVRQARKIARFGIQAVRSGRPLFIHCEEGKSRSAACAIAIGIATGGSVCFCEYGHKVLKGNELELYEQAGIKPNRLVLDCMMRACRRIRIPQQFRKQ